MGLKEMELDQQPPRFQTLSQALGQVLALAQPKEVPVLVVPQELRLKEEKQDQLILLSHLLA